MKNLAKIIGLLIVVFSGCSTIHTVSTYDDIYYSPTRAQELAEIAPAADAKPVRIDPDPVTDYKDQYDYNEQYNYDENLTQPPQPETLYDYTYTARIRRFHRYHHLGFGFYDPFFTNMFWYTHDPFYYGVSVYLGHGAVGFYYPGFFHSWGYRPWGWAHHGFGWGFAPMWGSPFYWGNTFGYWSGYHHGFWSGYRHGFWASPYWQYQYIYNSLDRNNYFYGHRRSTGSTVAEGTTTRGASGRNINNQSFAERFETSENRIETVRQGRMDGTSASGRRGSEVETGRTRELEGTPGRSASVVPQDASVRRGAGGVASDPSVRSEGEIQRGSQGRSAQESPGRISSIRTQEADQPQRETRTQQTQPQRDVTQEARPVQSPRDRYQPSRTPSDFSTPRREQVQRTPEPRYERPQIETPARRAPAVRPDQVRPRTYTPPSQQQPRSNQEYRSPGSEQRPQQAAPVQTRPQATPQGSAPQQTRPQAVPQRTQPDQERPQAAPQRTAPVQQRATPPTQTRPVAAPQQRSSPSQPQAAPSRAPQRSASPAVSSPPRSSSPASGSSAPSSSGSSGSSQGSSRSSSGGSGRR